MLNPFHIFKLTAWKKLVRELLHMRSPFRIVRWYVLRILHPIQTLKRRRLARRLWKEEGPERRERLESLLRKGVGIAQQDLDPQLLKEVCMELRRRAKGVAVDPTKEHAGTDCWKSLLTEEDLKTDRPFVRLALQPAVIAAASAYFGEVPYLSSVKGILSHPMERDWWKAVQEWHYDHEDRKTLRLFIYVTDVRDEQDGPFTYIDAEHSKKIPNTFFPRGVKDETIRKYGGEDNIQRLLGPAESAFYIDPTSCYHCGSRMAPGHHRIAYMATFVSFAAKQPFIEGFHTKTVVNTNLSELETLVLSSVGL